MTVRKSRKNTIIKPTLIWLHRWVGIATGLVVVIVCVTGTILAFEDEYREWRNPQRYAESTGGWPTSLTTLFENAVAGEEPGYSASSVSFYPASDRPASIVIRGEDMPRKTVYLHAGGEVVEASESTRDLMSWTMRIHRGFVGGDIARAAVGISTILFILTLFFAIPLWWPKTLKKLKQGLTVNWTKANWTRRIYDLHVSLGMWALVLLVIIAFTGLPFAYRWAGNLYYVATGSERAPASPLSDSTGVGKGFDLGKADLDLILAQIRTVDKNPTRVSISVPTDANGSIRVRVYPIDAANAGVQGTYYFDQYTGGDLGMIAHADLSLGARMSRGNYSWHVGSMGGLPTKLLWGFVSFLGATFPVTGFLMWYRRRARRIRKEGDKENKAANTRRPPVGATPPSKRPGIAARSATPKV